MHIIVGLGNPEKDYKGTRHNMGFETVNKLAYDHNVGINKAKFRAHLGEGHVAGQRVLLAKPQTYMNLSGESVREILAFYKLPPESLIVIYDDTSLELGQIRVRERGSAGGQKGMANVIYQLETDDIVRVRVGIGEKPPGWDLADYVTSRFKPNEMEAMVEGVTKAADAVEIILRHGVQEAMNRFNPKPKPKPKKTPDTQATAPPTTEV